MPTPIEVTVGDVVLTATLGDGPAARAFAELLPLELTLSDYHATEKVSPLPEKLPTRGEPPGHTAVVGDFTYYAPWGNLAIFYRPFGYAEGLIHLGRFDEDLRSLVDAGGRVRLARADE